MVKPVAHFRSKGPQGNIYWILGLVRTVLHEQHRITDYNTLRDEVLESGSYEQALAAIRKVVDLIDDDGAV